MCPVLIEIKLFWQILVEVTNMKFSVNLGVTLVHADRHMDMTQVMFCACDVPEKYDGSVLSSTAYKLCFFTWMTGFGNWAQTIEDNCMQICGC
jgi:hypothetical protein